MSPTLHHLHIVIRNRPDVGETWSDKEVAWRWLPIFPGKRIEEWLGNPTQADVEAPSTQSATAILSKLGIADGMWCDLVWNFKKYFGRSRGAGSPDNMREDAVSQSLSFQAGQNMARECFAKAK